MTNTIQIHSNNPQEHADAILKRSRHDFESIYKTEPARACRMALAATRGVPWKIRLEVCNLILRAYGTEGIRGEWQNGYWCNIVAAYVNMGDTYATTILHVRGGWNEAGKFHVSSWGDWVERNGAKHGVE